MLNFTNMQKVIGVKQTKKALKESMAKRVIMALDADADVTDPIRELCTEHEVPVEDFPSMKELGAECGIDVGAAVVCELRG